MCLISRRTITLCLMLLRHKRRSLNRHPRSLNRHPEVPARNYHNPMPSHRERAGLEG